MHTSCLHACLHWLASPRRLEGSKQALEAEIKEMRKAAKEELSELKLEQNCAKQVRQRGKCRSGWM